MDGLRGAIETMRDDYLRKAEMLSKRGRLIEAFQAEKVSAELGLFLDAYPEPNDPDATPET